MTATGITPYHSTVPPGRDGFAQSLRAEFTKVSTVRGWTVGLMLAVLLTTAVAVLTAIGGQTLCSNSPTGPTLSGAACRQVPPTGPDGTPVSDNFYFVHRSLAEDGSITVRLTSLTGLYRADGAAQAGAGAEGMTSGTQPWSKAGILIKANSTQGSAYAAMMVTGGNGVRMQYDYTHDIAGEPGTGSPAPRWLRLTRSGETVTGYDSADGTHWTRVGSATLAGLPATVQAGMFAASPDHTVVTSQSLGGGSSGGSPSLATGTFDEVSLAGGPRAADAWTGTAMGGEPRDDGQAGHFSRTADTFTVTGSGDIAPAAGQGTGRPIEQSLAGDFAGLIAIIVVSALFVTAEYRRGLIRVTLAANPRRGRVLAAKAVVIGVVGFTVGLVAAGISLPLGNHLAYNHGDYILPASAFTEARVIVGTAAIFAVVAVLSVAVGTLLRRSAATVTLVIVAIVLTYILSVASVLPGGVAEWLTRLSPAAAFSLQQTLVAYPQVTASYTPADGYYPLAPWAGFAVLCAYTAITLALASRRLRRRDV